MSAYTILLEASGAFYEALAHEDDTLVENGSDGGLIGAERQMPVIDRVSLSRYGESLGEFRVQSMEAFPSVGRIQLSVV
jgi:hypothetical protein